MNELEQLEKTIGVLEAQRAILGEDVVETALAPLRQKLAALQAGEQPSPSAEKRARPEAEARDGDRIDQEESSLAAPQTLTNLAVRATEQGDVVGARATFERRLRTCRDAHDREGEAAAINGLGSISLYLGDYHRARDLIEQSLAIYRQIGDRQGESASLAALGQLCCQIRSYEEARSYSQQALAAAEETGSLTEEADALTYLGHAYHGLKNLDEAFDAYQKAYQIRQELGYSDLLLDDLAGLARVKMDRRELIQAQTYVEEIMNSLSSRPNANTDEPARVYLTCVRVLEASGDLRAQAVVEIAYAWLQERAARIRGEGSRNSFLWNVPANREITAEWEKRTYEE